MKPVFRTLRSTIALVALAAVAACDGVVGVSDTASLRILITDAPADYIDSAFVDIGAVELLPGGDGERIVLTENGTDGEIDLLQLQGFTTATLADVDIPAGTYKEIRLIVESARVVLAEGYEFPDGATSAPMRVPSGASSGIKLKLRPEAVDETGSEGAAGEGEGGEEVESGGIEIIGGQTVLVVDFDVNRSFRIQGNPETPAGIKGVSFKPTLRVAVADLSGDVSGTVSTALTDVALEGLVVTAERVESEEDTEFQSWSGTAMTNASGMYTLAYLAPGTYIVTVATSDETLSSVPESIEVVVEPGSSIVDVDFELVR